MSKIEIFAIGLLIAIALYTDIRKQIIPNLLIIIFFSIGVIYQISWYGGAAIIPSLIGGLAGFIPLLIVHLLKGIGAGDVKLFGVIGLWCGAFPVLQLTIYSILFAGGIGLFLLIFQYGLKKTYASAIMASTVLSDRKHWFQWAQSGSKFPFMIAVAPAYVTVWLL